MTPYDKLQSLDNAERFLNPGVTFDQLDAIAHAVSDLEAANALNDARDALFEPPRESRRLHLLSLWEEKADDFTDKILPGSPGAGSAPGAGSPG